MMIAEAILTIDSISERKATSLQRRGNQIARRAGYGRATEIVLGTADRVVSHVDWGYRKYTTGEYVAGAYRNHFGWKNTYYQDAHTLVEIAV